MTISQYLQGIVYFSDYTSIHKIDYLKMDWALVSFQLNGLVKRKIISE